MPETRRTRTLVVWCPDWPVVAAARAQGYGADTPLAVVVSGRVRVCSQAAREASVRRGLRIREAQSRCPELIVLGYDPTVDARVFEPVVAAVEALVPGVEIVRPGVCCVAVRRAARYFGSEGAVVAALARRLAESEVVCQIGVADGPFAAEQAARAGVRIPAGESASWLASLPVTALDRPELTSLLHRLGVHTLGAFAALPAEQVLARFGVDGARAHRMAGGQDDRPLAVRKPPPELTVRVDLEPPVDRVDTVAFSTRESAQRFVSGLSAHELVCTCLRLEIESEREEISRRCWRHPRGFSATEVVDRIRWQLQSVGQRPARGLAAPVTRVALIPEEVDRAGAFPEGLWGERAPDADVHRVLSRIQSMLGHTAVVTAVPSGGRGPAERVTLVPWGDQRTPDRLIDPPWPGQLPPPAPTQVWSPPRPTQVLAASGQPVEVDERAVVSAPPAWLVPALRAGDGAGGDMHGEGRSEPEPIVAWAGPWPVDERWWDASTARRRARFQVAVADGRAWLLAFEGGHWWIEAGYA